MEKLAKVKSGSESVQIIDELKRKEIEAFRKETAIQVVQKIISSATLKSFENKEVRIIGGGRFFIPKEVSNRLELASYLLRNAASKGDVSWLLKQVEYEEGKTLDDLKSPTKQNLNDIDNNKWFYGLFDKIRSVEGCDTMSVQQLAVLSLIAKFGDNGVTTSDICDALDTRLSSIQRQLGRLAEGYEFRSDGKQEVRKRDGLFFITQFEDPNNRKQKRWVLDTAGIKFFKQLNSVK